MISLAKVATAAATVILMTAAAQISSAQLAPITPIASLDLQRYQGTWYEIAKYPNRFQAMCVKSTSAQYAIQASGTVTVTNSCTDKTGATTTAIGEARLIGADKNPQSATLQVRFAPAWLSWLPFVWGDYWVVAIDPQYQWSIVSEPKREFLWVLSRSKQLDATAWAAIEAQIKRAGLDLSKLEKTIQD